MFNHRIWWRNNTSKVHLSKFYTPYLEPCHCQDMYMYAIIGLNMIHSIDNWWNYWLHGNQPRSSCSASHLDPGCLYNYATFVGSGVKGLINIKIPVEHLESVHVSYIWILTTIKWYQYVWEAHQSLIKK